MPRFVRWWAVAFATWLLLVTTLARQELVLGAVVAVVVATIAVALTRLDVITWALPREWWRLLVALPAQVAHDLAVLGRVLVRPDQADSAFRALPFDTGGDEPIDVGRRVLVALAGSVGPNTVVLGYDAERHLVLVHQLDRNEQVLPLPNGRYPT